MAIARERTLSLVVPVYRGEATLEQLVTDCEPLFRTSYTAGGVAFRVVEMILVWDRGPDESDEVIRRLTASYAEIDAVWLSRNFGQHAATCAGIAASHGEWVVTLDEDGQHDPAEIGSLLDSALTTRSRLVYAQLRGPTSHGLVRDAFSRAAKMLNRRFLTGRRSAYFSSFRLIHGEIARVVAATAGPNAYLDAALAWSVESTVSVPIRPREERRTKSGYTSSALRAHFARLVASAGPRPLSIIAGTGATVAATGLGLASWVILGGLRGSVEVAGWASLMAATLLLGGLLLLATSVVAAYLAVSLRILLGQPLFMIVEDDAAVFEQ
jgi:hypothetical protein